MITHSEHLASCPHCGLIQEMPDVPTGMRACCARCEGTIHLRTGPSARNSRAGAIAAAGLILYPLAVSLPLMEIEQFGHTQAASVLDGVTVLLGGGHLLVGITVLVCSVFLPLLKLLSLLVLSSGIGLGHRHRALTYRLIEWTGRWGMLDVLLVAILVAVLKLGDLMSVSAGPGLLAFATCVGLSLAATAVFDPHSHWESQP
jgi:paraquat-inducible protein A